MNSIPKQLFELDSFESDEEFLELVSKLDTEVLVDYVRILERMCSLWPCSLNIKYYCLIYYSLDATHYLPIEYRLEMGKNILTFEMSSDQKNEFIKFTNRLLYDSGSIHVSLSFNMFEYMLRYETIDNNSIMEALFKTMTHVRYPEHIRCSYVFRTQSILPIASFSSYLLKFFNDTDISLSTKLMVCQYILNHFEKIDTDVIDIHSILAFLQILLSDSRELLYVRTDIADMLLGVRDEYKHLIPDDLRDMAIQVIMEVGGNRMSVYHNQENVHQFQDSNITPILHKLQKRYEKVNMKRSLESDISLLQNRIPKDDPEEKTKIELAIIRIQLDNQYYNNLKLCHICQYVISFILDHPDQEDDLWKRLLEELSDMSGKCTTGYALRLLNTLSGFDESLTLHITDEDRFKSIFFHKLNELLKEQGEGDSYAEILYELAVPSSRPEQRKNFLNFFKKAFPIISSQMFEEFKEELSETDIDLYLRKAFCAYEES